MNFALNLKKARKKLGISQAELADRLGVAQGAIGNWELGIRTPKLEALELIARVLKTIPEELIK